jgi:hypothetical protein
MEMSWQAVKAILREVMEEEMGMSRRDIAGKWNGGTVVLKPGNPDQQSKEIPIDVFFKKVTSVRERLRVLEQKINNHSALSMEDRADLQQLITRAYGSLTTFNILFANDDDKFVGQKGG